MPITIHSFLTPAPRCPYAPATVIICGTVILWQMGLRTPDAVKDGRVRRLYRRQLDGLSARALVYDHAEKEQVSIPTAWRDWRDVKELVDEDWKEDRENMLARLQHMRTKLFHQALKKGQLQTASQVLDSIGRVIGEATEVVNIQAPDLTIKIENKTD